MNPDIHKEWTAGLLAPPELEFDPAPIKVADTLVVTKSGVSRRIIWYLLDPATDYKDPRGTLTWVTRFTKEGWSSYALEIADAEGVSKMTEGQTQWLMEHAAADAIEQAQRGEPEPPHLTILKISDQMLNRAIDLEAKAQEN